MKQYRCKSSGYTSFKMGNIYDEDAPSRVNHSYVKDYVIANLRDWGLVAIIEPVKNYEIF